MIILVAVLLGALVGGAICMRLLLREVAGDIGPKLKRIENQLNRVETELELAHTTRMAEIAQMQWLQQRPTSGSDGPTTG